MSWTVAAMGQGYGDTSRKVDASWKTEQIPRERRGLQVRGDGGTSAWGATAVLFLSQFL